MNWSPVQKLSIGAGAALLVLALFGAVAFAAVSRLSQQQEDVADANTAIAQLDQLVAASADAERAGAQFMLTGSQEALDAFEQSRGRAQDALDILRQRAEDRPRERTALEALGPLIGQRFMVLNTGITTRRRFGADSAMTYARADTGRATRAAMIPFLQRMRDEELTLLAERTRLETARGKTAANVILGGSVLAFVLALIAFTPIKPSLAARLTRRLTTPHGIPAIPEFAESAKESGRAAGDRLVRLEQLAFALDTPKSADVVGEALITRGLAGVTPAATLVVQFNGNAWHIVARRSTKAGVGSALPADTARPCVDVARTGEPVVVESQAERDKLYPDLASFGTAAETALITVPLAANGRVLGALLLAYDGARVFGDDERAYLATLGRLGGQALIRI